jgi:hypothetical protein
LPEFGNDTQNAVHDPLIGSCTAFLYLERVDPCHSTDSLASEWNFNDEQAAWHLQTTDIVKLIYQ